jgi:flagellar biosynthesis/type III secretory pathway chaperone
MPYNNRIKTLEESYRLVDNQLFQLEKSGSTDSDKIQKLREAKQKYLSELQHMRRIQWDHDHERVDFEDDR